MKGTMTIKALFYMTKSNGKTYNKFYEEGFSKIQEINNANQEEIAFNQALANAIHKYSYHTGQKYDDSEFNYELIDSHVVYINEERDVKTKKYGRHREKTKLTGGDKRRIHRAVLVQAEQRREDKNKDEKVTREEINSYYKQKVVDTQSTYGKSKKVTIVNPKTKKKKKVIN